MAAKCNIIGLVIEQLNAVNYGLRCNDVSCAIIENYIEYLDCPDVRNEICNPDNDCTNDPVDFNCNFNIFDTTNEPVEEEDWDTVFLLQAGDYIGGTPPFTYSWTFDTDDWEAIGGTNSSQLKLALKPGKVLNLLVTPITVQVTDSNGCVDTKTCYFNLGSMICRKTFVSCNNSQNLQVVPIYP